MRVIAADVDEEKIEVQAARLRNQGADIHAVAVDVRDSDAVDRVGQAAIERFGALHVAVNNAGVVMTGNSWEIALEEWHRVIDIDLWGVIHGIRTFVPLILTSGQEGHVVNVASMAAVLPFGQVGPYTVAKHGVLGLSDVLRAELETLGAPVGVSVVMPGLIRTAMNPIGTVEPSTVARNVVDAIRRRRSCCSSPRSGMRARCARPRSPSACCAGPASIPSTPAPSPAARCGPGSRWC